MLARLRKLVGILLVPALMIAGASGGVYALFECSMMGTVKQSQCCCAGLASAAQDEAPHRVERASCCTERTVTVEATQADFGPSFALAAPPQAFVRLAIRDLYAPVLAYAGFALREAPRAIGPPLILLYRVLRL